jgi:hypothetical protein
MLPESRDSAFFVVYPGASFGPQARFGRIRRVPWGDKLFFGDYAHFLESSIWGDQTHSYFEKSDLDVYDAFEKDFEPLENVLFAKTKSVKE